MTKLKLIGAALALALPTAAFAAGSCCADMACCKEGADCCTEHDGKSADCCAKMKGDGKAGGLPSLVGVSGADGLDVDGAAKTLVGLLDAVANHRVEGVVVGRGEQQAVDGPLEIDDERGPRRPVG